MLVLDISKAPKAVQSEDFIAGLEAIGLTTLLISPEFEKKVLPQNAHIHFVEPKEKEDAYQAADFAIVMNGDIAPALKNGCVPISKLDGETTANYNPLQEKGNGFYFKNPTKWEMFAAIVRALETYQFPYDWENLIRGIIGKN